MRLTTLPIQDSTYILSFQLFPLRFQSGHTSIIHFTAHGKNMKKYGDRNPGIWFNPGSEYDAKNSLHICSAVNNNKNYCFNTKKTIPRNQWTAIEISQLWTGGHHRYQIRVDGELVHSRVNTVAKGFSKVKVYAGDPWYNSLQGYIRGIVIAPNIYQIKPGNSMLYLLTVEMVDLLQNPLALSTCESPLRLYDGFILQFI